MRLNIGLIGAALLVAMPSALAAQRGRADVTEGNRLYEEGLFIEAHEKYLEALRAAPGSPLVLFNDGNALYQSEEYERALDAYRQAIESGDPAWAGPAWYNLGNALYRGQQLGESLEAFKQALRSNPDDLDYKHNLERVLEQLEEQEQEQEPQDGEGDPEDEEQDPQDQEQQDAGDQEDEQQDQQEDEQEQQPQDSQDDQESEEEQEQPERAPGEMSQEEAERLLQAVQEDPDDVSRKAQPVRGRRPQRPW